MVKKITQLLILTLLGCIFCSIDSYAQKKDGSKTGEYEIEVDYKPESSPTAIAESPSSIQPSVFDGKFVENDNFVKAGIEFRNALQLKENCLVMLRQNDPKGRWVNGTTATLEEVKDDHLLLKLIRNET